MSHVARVLGLVAGYVVVVVASIEAHKYGSSLGWWLNGIPSVLTLAHDRPFVAVPDGKEIADVVGTFPVVLSKYLGATITLGLAVGATLVNRHRPRWITYFLGLANTSLKGVALLVFLIAWIGSGTPPGMDEAALTPFGSRLVMPLLFLAVYVACLVGLGRTGPKGRSAWWLTSGLFIVGGAILLGAELLDQLLGTKGQLDTLDIQ